MSKKNYYGFTDWEDLKSQFQEKDLGGEPEFIYAVYSFPCYSGNAQIVYKANDGRWYHVEGGHCSCYGLEEQWSPQPVNPQDHLDALKENKRLLNVYDTEGDDHEATKEAFDQWLEWAVKQ